MEATNGGGGKIPATGRRRGALHAGDWRRRAVIPFKPGEEPPGESWTKEVAGGTLRAQLWGNGGPGAPWVVQIAHRATLPPNRFPTWEEIQEALHFLTEDGAVFSLPPFQVNGESYKVILASLDVGGWAEMPFIQTGAREGSEASKRSPIIVVGGPHGNA